MNRGDIGAGGGMRAFDGSVRDHVHGPASKDTGRYGRIAIHWRSEKQTARWGTARVRQGEWNMSVTAVSSDVGSVSSLTDRAPLLRWMIFTGLCAFAAALLRHYGLIRLMIASDRTYLSAIIGVLYVVTSLHCLWRTIVIAREADAGRGVARVLAESGAAVPATAGPLGAPHCRQALLPITFTISC